MKNIILCVELSTEFTQIDQRVILGMTLRTGRKKDFILLIFLNYTMEEATTKCVSVFPYWLQGREGLVLLNNTKEEKQCDSIFSYCFQVSR